LIAWLALTASLGWRASIWIHERVGRALWWLLPRRRRIVVRNLEICFPELDAAAIRALAKRHFESLGVCLGEIGLAWFGSQERLARRFRIEGLEHVHAALARGKGVILFSGHFTSLEICTPVIKTLVPRFAFMFKTRSNPLLDAMQVRGRQRAAHASVSNDDVRALLRELHGNAVVWYAPDQAHVGQSGELVPFFGEPAMTNTATSRIARITGAAIVPLFFRRLPGRAGYLLRFEPSLVGLPSDDETQDTTRLMGLVERFVRECPEQYFWTHRKFKSRPAALPDAYGQAEAAPSRERRRDLLATPLAIALVAAFITTLDNDAFWSAALRATTLDEHQLAILLAMFAIMFGTLVAVLALAAGRWTLKIVGATLLLVAAAAGYFMSEYGVIIDPSMIRNVAETQIQEASPLLTMSYLWHVAVFGVLPALALLAAPLPKVSWRRGFAARTAVAAASLVAMLTIVYANFAPVSFFAHQHHAVRLFMNPGYPIYSLVQYALRRSEDRPAVVRAPLDASVAPAHAALPKRTLLVFVVGETARADRFSLNGYARDTNRYTRPLGVLNFAHVSSCGTSTAESVPCIFSGLGRAKFTHAGFAARESLFGTLDRLGAKVFWRDNSTGCKSVCDPSHFEEYATRKDADYCDDSGCFDEILLRHIGDLAADSSRDHFIVLHQRGSHGPAYHTDTPKWSKAFLPECDLANLRNCDRELINNAYDNTVLYSDYFVSRVIEFLKTQQDAYDVAMLYVSDHGESLGENGLYLHGFPYSIAPPEQTRVPLQFWGSPEFFADNGVDAGCLRGATSREVSHDWIYHTLLPLFGVRSPSYDASLDLFAGCRAAGGDAPVRVTRAGS
jgi:lipid A ethanolaminephosphotransferase